MKIMFVCLGNICRSAMAEFMMKDALKSGGYQKIRYRLRRDVRARSGQSRLSRRAEKLKEHDVPTFPHYSKQVRKTDYDKYDLFIGMDDKTLRISKSFAPDEKRK